MIFQNQPQKSFEYLFLVNKTRLVILLGMKKTFLGAVEVTERMLNDVIFMCESRVKPTYFTRKGNNKLDFKSTIMFNLNLVKKTIQLELDAFFKIVNPSDISITKQGYSEARKKISPSAFIKLASAVVDWFYEDNAFKTFYGYRLCAIDGSVFELNNTENLRKHYGYVQNQTVTYARARAATIYDIENDIILMSKIAPYTSSERDMAMDMIEELTRMGLKNDLILFDRGYPSRKFIAFLEELGIKYVMRCPKSTMKEIVEAKGADQIIKIVLDGKLITARVLRFQLDSGEEEILVTNLMEETLGTPEFKALYFKRWGIETKYDELKNKLQIENFSGCTQIAVEQDFYASIYLINMVSLIKNEANETISQNDKGKKLKYTYKVNTNIIIGKLKESMVRLLLEESPRKRKAMFTRMMVEIIKNKTPIRPGRKYQRNKVLKSNKYAQGRKRCL